jgi:tetratricopeptide (TPR) repeat protein
MKKCFIALIFTLSVPLFAQPSMPPWWLSLEQGKQKFRSKDYGSALMSFEDARRNRRAMYEQMERDFIHLLSINEVRRYGETLEWVEKYARERYYIAASAALDELYYRVPKASLQNSSKLALEAIGRLKDYPEAEYWIGEIYRVEGELSLALAQYRKVYEMRDSLEDQGFAIDLQYKIAHILLVRQEYNEMIRTLLAVINEYDSLWINAAAAEVTKAQIAAADERHRGTVPYAQAEASFASQAMNRTLENEGITRFMELYRYNNRIVEPAHRQLGFFYSVTGRTAAQQHLVSAFLIQNTIIIEEIMRRQYDFTFTDLSALAAEINKNALLKSYVEEVEYYKTIYYLGAALFRNGKTTIARNFWSFLAGQPQAGEWYNRAASQLRNPRLEPVVEMP